MGGLRVCGLRVRGRYSVLDAQAYLGASPMTKTSLSISSVYPVLLYTIALGVVRDPISVFWTYASEPLTRLSRVVTKA
jgi:hypothetical protein